MFLVHNLEIHRKQRVVFQWRHTAGWWDMHHLLIRRWLFANHSRTNACKTPNINLVKSTLNLTLTLTLTLAVNLTLNPTLNINFIPHKNNHKWAVVREWLVSSHCRHLQCCCLESISGPVVKLPLFVLVWNEVPI